MEPDEVRKIAHYVPMSRQLMEDSAGMRPEIDFLITTGRSRWTNSEAITLWKPTWFGRLLAKVRTRG